MPLGALVRDILEFCYPSACFSCDAQCDPGSRFCDECEKQLVTLESAPSCQRCAMPLPLAGSPCPYCLAKGVRPFSGIARLAIFEEPLRKLIHHIKYRGQWTIAEILADRLAGHPSVQQVMDGAQVIVPVPLHPLRQISRGFNQADVIARRLAWHQRKHRIRVFQPVTRVRNNPPQVDATSRAERVRNLRGVFHLTNPKSVAGKHVVIVDDVMTTGATLRSLARVLIPARPASIGAVVLAIADPKGRGFQRI